jgi:TonB family protein
VSRCRPGHASPLLVLLVASACGGAPASQAPPPAAAESPPPEEPAAVAEPLPEQPKKKPKWVRGLTGTLNKDDVHQTMDARQPEFDACIARVRRRHRWVEGEVRFDFVVDGEGKVARAETAKSTIGNAELERCLAQVVQATVFPRPAGRARATFSWDLQVYPAGGRRADPLVPKDLRKLLRKKAREAFRGCEVRRRRNRLVVTAYVGRRGQVLSVGAVPNLNLPEDKLECMLEQVRSWRMPRVKRRSKVTFMLK